MNRKITKAVKHTLKTDIDKADNFVKLAYLGKIVGATEQENLSDSKETRELIITELKKYREKISKGTEQYLNAIDEAIEAIS